MLCLENIELTAKTKKVSKERPKCPNCKKVLKYQQNYIENKYVKPLEQTHTIVMAQNLNILHYMYKKIVCKNLASVGYYVGGMSEPELKLSEKKQIILASYSMSQEGLDIPTLNAEFLITPKTDIVQTVGRILRAKHIFSHPIIYDFVDIHDVFQRQWLKRKSYYKKQNYKIIGINSLEYNSNNSKWREIYKPKENSSNKLCIKKPNSIKSNSSSDKSITCDSDIEEDDEIELEEKPKDKYLSGKCLLSFKK
jgi:superfamily II DNA or RNA helicase